MAGNDRGLSMIFFDGLGRYPLFGLLGARWCEWWLKTGQSMDLQAGETLFQAGTEGTWAYLILEGRVRALRSTPGGRQVTMGVFGPGEIFGEYALVPPGMNTSTCRTTVVTALLRLPLGPLREVIATRSLVSDNLKNWLRLHEALRFLRQESFLGFMSASSVLQLLDRFEPALFPEGYTIQAPGLADDRFFFIESGAVGRHRDGSSPRHATRLGAGDLFGASALSGGGLATISLALSEVRCQVLSRKLFLDAEPHYSLQTTPPRLSTQAFADTWIGQRDTSDCGLASLAMVLKYYHRESSIPALRLTSPPRPSGLSLGELRDVAKALGFGGQAVRVAPSQWEQLCLPAIAHMNADHYVVVFAVGRDGVVIGDPEKGVLKVSRESFEFQCSGHLLLVRPLPF